MFQGLVTRIITLKKVHYNNCMLYHRDFQLIVNLIKLTFFTNRRIIILQDQNIIFNHGFASPFCRFVFDQFFFFNLRFGWPPEERRDTTRDPTFNTILARETFSTENKSLWFEKMNKAIQWTSLYAVNSNFNFLNG